MRLLVVIIRYEWRLQWRALRFRLGAVTYLALSALPAAVVAIRERGLTLPPTGGAYLWHTLSVSSFLVVALSALVVGNTARVEGESLILRGSPLTNAGWVARKWLALLSVVAPISAAGMAVPVGVTYLVEAGPLPIANAGWSWLFRVLPLALVVTAGWYGLLRITKSEIAAFFVAVLGGAALPLLLNQLLALAQLRVDVSGWTGFRELTQWAYLTTARAWRWSPASDGPIDADLAFQALLPWLGLPAAVALVCLGAAIGYLERTRPNSPPHRVRGDHPIGSFVLAFGRLRDRLRPDAGLERRDRLARGLAMSAAAALLLLVLGRAWSWLAVARERYRVEVTEVAHTTSRAIVPEEIAIEGKLSRSGVVELWVVTELSNQGEEPVSHLAFEVNRHLELSDLEVVLVGEMKQGAVGLQRHFDRVILELDPPLPGSRAATLRYRLDGQPRSDRMNLLRLGNEGFAASFERHLDGSSLSALAHSRSIRVASARWISLEAADLMLAPRWDPWTLTPDAGRGRAGREVPEETHLPEVALRIDLHAPKSWVVADSCGGLANGSSTSRLESRCTLRLSELRISGGGGRVLAASEDERANLGALRGHQGLGHDLLVSLARVVELSERAWPGIERLESVTALERPTTGEERRYSWYRTGARPALYGRAIEIPESLLLSLEPIAAAPLAASILTRNLRVRRPVDPAERPGIDATLRTLLLLRMGLGADSAWVWAEPWDLHRLRLPIAQAPPHDLVVWGRRMPAVLRSIQARVGADTLIRGVRRFLDEPGEKPVGLRDLLGAIELESQQSLEQLYQDFFVRGKLPDLRLLDVRSQRQGARFQVGGKLKNLGSGEARCTLVVRSNTQEVEQVVVVGDHEEAPFVIELRTQPHTLAFDPDRECFQLRDPARSVNEINLQALPSTPNRGSRS